MRNGSMIFIVDGTGEADEKKYEKDMANGFCKRIEKSTRGKYWRGPTLSGWQTFDIAEKVVESVREWTKAQGSGGTVFLAGHSRGGAAVIFAAEDLKKLDIKVEAMFLFDAVDRVVHRMRAAETIPSNVRHCYHAVRDPSLTFYYSEGVQRARDEVAKVLGLPGGRRSSTMEDMIDWALKSPPKPGTKEAKVFENAQNLLKLDYKMKLRMRSVTMDTPDGFTLDFGNCGMRTSPGCNFQVSAFLGSHGAIGGAPITEDAPQVLIDADRAAIASVWAWMSKFLSMHGVMQA